MRDGHLLRSATRAPKNLKNGILHSHANWSLTREMDPRSRGCKVERMKILHYTRWFVNVCL